MFGLTFSGRQGVQRILTDYGFAGHPLRKDFPLSGFYELLYVDRKARLCVDRLALTQEFRVFHL